MDDITKKFVAGIRNALETVDAYPGLSMHTRGAIFMALSRDALSKFEFQLAEELAYTEGRDKPLPDGITW